ncbi:MAG: hypothetical protein COA58_14110 [Bacteroidetes bacterium]|nr:MAG: hypothetical protein COA58_14110 [Bacteroidota bacterium]
MSTHINESIDHLFRREYSRIVSLLTSKFGPVHIDSIEDSVQDALYKAMTQWSIKGRPEEPNKWLYRVAHNSIIDKLRRDSKSEEYLPEKEKKTSSTLEVDLSDGLEDEQLQMIFACCHPSMKETEQLMLSLKLLCGFNNKEISRALLKEQEAVKKALTRAKSKFKTEIGSLRIPHSNQLASRLDGVLKVIYLIFNNGYTALEGDNLLKKDVCEDAIRLAGMLYQHEKCNTNQTRSLLALMCFNFSRFNARINEVGDMLTLQQQDHNKWDTDLIELGLRFLSETGNSSTFTQLQLEAAIAREYAVAPNFETTNWRVILALFDLILTNNTSVVIALNRLVIVDQVYGTQTAYERLLKLQDKSLEKNYLYFSIKGDFEKKLKLEEYKTSLNCAVDLTDNLKEKEFLKAKLSN